MSQPVKLSDALILDARQTGAVAERSIAGQIEFWARLGRAVEPLLSGDRVLALRRAGDAQPLSALIASVDTSEGRQRVADLLAALPFPHYQPASGNSGLVVRTEESGQQCVGKFVRGEFRVVPVKPSSGAKKSKAKGRNGHSPS